LSKKKKKKLDLKPFELATTNRWAQKQIRKAKSRRTKILKKRRWKKLTLPEGTKTQSGTPIPVDVKLGDYEDQVLHRKVAEYFIQKAGTIVIVDCPCRVFNKCKNHDVHLGCTYFGKGAAHIDLSKYPGARLATKEEALELERLAYEDGLIPHIGKFRGDAFHFGVIEYEHELMNICHCCSCCCVVSLEKYTRKSYYKEMVRRMEGVEVRIDPDKCTGCGLCFKNCIYDGLRMKKDKAVIKQSNCMGCGRCERTCPNKAVSVTIDDYSRIDELIARFEERTDITG
jgi:UDP-glucose 4-epimerase